MSSSVFEYETLKHDINDNVLCHNIVIVMDIFSFSLILGLEICLAYQQIMQPALVQIRKSLINI